MASEYQLPVPNLENPLIEFLQYKFGMLMIMMIVFIHNHGRGESDDDYHFGFT